MADHCVWAEGKHIGGEHGGQYELKVVDLRTGKFSTVPHSKGKIGAYWVNQNLIVAASQELTKFWLFDLSTNKWTLLTSGMFVNGFYLWTENIFTATPAAPNRRDCSEYGFRIIAWRTSSVWQAFGGLWTPIMALR